MHDNEIRWYALIPVGILLCFGCLFLETAGVWGAFPARPEWLWCLAFCATLRAPPVQSTAAFFLCGLLRDLLIGPRLGAGAAAFTAMGWVALHWRFIAVGHGWIGQAALAGWAGMFVAMIRHALECGPLAYALLSRVFFLGIADGALTGLAYLPLAALLCLPSFRPWRQRSGV